MHEFTVTVTIETKARLTEQLLFAIAAIGGAASGNVGERRIETTLTVESGELLDAIARGVVQLLKLAPGQLIAAEGMTVEEADRRLAEGEPMLGVSEIATMLGVSKQRASVVARRRDFPKPAATLAQGKTWRKVDVEQFVSTWERKEGRPSANQRDKTVVAARVIKGRLSAARQA